MAYYEADCEDLPCDEDDTPIGPYSTDDEYVRDPNAMSYENEQPEPMDLIATQDYAYDAEDPSAYSDDSEYSLDYEYLGPRNPNYRRRDDPDSDASELSDNDSVAADYQPSSAGFDMWDEDPYSTNDYTWESNDMRLTHFIKSRQEKLNKLPWQHKSFWRKEKGWPKQLPSSSSTTNHDQAANALCLVLSNYGLEEQLYAVYRNRIYECGRLTSPDQFPLESADERPKTKYSTTHDTLTWIDSDHVPYSSTSSKPPSPPPSSSIIPSSSTTATPVGNASTSSSGSSSTSTSSKFCETHLSVSLKRSTANSINDKCTFGAAARSPVSGISRFRPFTKYIKRADFPPVYAQDAYMALDFEPLCLAQKYGYMAIGGLEGEFELYCCMDRAVPRKIWGTKFKSRDNVQLMTNAVQIVRWRKQQEENDEKDEEAEYEYMLIACMNEAGILIYKLPTHRECQTMPACHQQAQVVQLYTHLRCFDRVPINDAKVSPDGKQMVCVGDDSYVFILDIVRDDTGVSFGAPVKLHVPSHLLRCGGVIADEMPYSSQYVAWSRSSQHFAHTSDTHSNVFVWRAETKQALYSIDAAGYTYAIAFHPRLEGVLAFTNRYGYFHTVNLDESLSNSNEVLSILEFDQQTSVSRGHICNSSCQGGDLPANHTRDLHAHQEITMVSFRGERDRRLRILAKINGIQWSNDGHYLYVATKKRVLAYEFLKTSRSINSLVDVTGKQARGLLERFHRRPRARPLCPPRRRSSRKRKRDDEEDPKVALAWLEKWHSVPFQIRHRVLGDTQLASHW